MNYQIIEVDKKGRIKAKHIHDGGSVNITVAPRPNVAPIANLNCVSPDFLKLTCNAEGSSDSDGTIVSYKYEWGDDSNTLAENNLSLTHDYVSSGEKLVRLTVTDDKGASHSVEKIFLIKENTKPTAKFECQKCSV